MKVDSTESASEIQSKIALVSKLVIDLLLPHQAVAKICTEIGHEYRDCVYTPMVTTWMFITQSFSADGSCQEAVARLNAWRVEHRLGRTSSDTAAYCKARSRLPEELFEKLLEWTSGECEAATNRVWLLKNRVVEMVDGFTVNMADTSANQGVYPQLKGQAPGCGFPIARMIGLFSLATGSINSIVMNAYEGKQTGETTMLRSILNRISPGRILLADRYYANYWLLATGEMQGVDLVARAHQLRKIDFRKGLKLGYLDQLVLYHKPQRPKWMSEEEYHRYPASIFVRHLKYKVTQKGFRTREITLATTLIDAQLYTAEELADLYRRRWQVELHIRSIKTQMKLDYCRCKTPSMVHKEIHCRLVGYNLVRAAMVASALRFGLSPSRLSFKGALQALNSFANALATGTRRKREHWASTLKTISELEVDNRPGRKEERVLKKRQKNYKLMKKPRDPNRNRFAAAA